MEKDPMHNKDNAGEKLSERALKTTPGKNEEGLRLDGEDLQQNGKDLKLDGKDLPLTGEDLLVEGQDLQPGKDRRIDQHIPGYTNAPSKEEIISTGSAGAFEATENTIDDADSDEDNDDLAMGHSKY